jgi:hypothetical protein
MKLLIEFVEPLPIPAPIPELAVLNMPLFDPLNPVDPKEPLPPELMKLEPLPPPKPPPEPPPGPPPEPPSPPPNIAAAEKWSISCFKFILLL